MDIKEFIEKFVEEVEVESTEVTAETKFRELEEWSSLAALSVISMVDDAYDKTITGADIRSCSTIEDLYKIVENK